MRKAKTLLTFFLCAACIVPSIHADAVVINRPGIETDDDREEGSHLTTDITEEIIPGSSEIVTENIVEPADIIFAIDSTGSMGTYIQNVADNVEEFSRHLEEKTLTHLGGKEVKVKTRMAVVEYKDITCDGEDSTIVHTVDGSPWHKSTEELIKTLQVVKANVDGGGDTPETVFDALGYVVDGKTFDFNKEEKDAHKFVIVLSDADFKEENRFGYTESSMIEKLKEEDVNVSVITNTWNYDSYKSIVANKENPTENLFDINSKIFSENLNKLADVIFKTIEDEIITPGTSTFKVTCKGDNTIKVGNSAELKAVFHPEIPANANVIWSVEDEDVASIEVSSDTLTCTVTGMSEGTTRVEAETEDGAFRGSYDIIVIGDEAGIAIEIFKGDIKVTPAKKTIAKKKSFNIKVALTEEFKEDKEEEEIDDIWESNVDSVTFRSSKSSVASVNAKGKVTGKKKGKAIITTTITLADNSEFKYKTTVYVK